MTQPLDLERAEKRLSEVAVALAHLSCGMALGAAYGHARSPEKVLAGDLRNLLDALSSERAARAEAEGERDRWKALAEHHFDHMRAALDLSYALRYPADPTLLDMIADEITCGDGCENAWREHDTNDTGCTKSDSADGCAWEKAQALRDHAKAIRDQAWLLAFSPPSPALAAEAQVSALQAQVDGLREIVPDLLAHSISHYGHPKDETFGVGLIHAKARALSQPPADEPAKGEG